MTHSRVGGAMGWLGIEEAAFTWVEGIMDMRLELRRAVIAPEPRDDDVAMPAVGAAIEFPRPLTVPLEGRSMRSEMLPRPLGAAPPNTLPTAATSDDVDRGSFDIVCGPLKAAFTPIPASPSKGCAPGHSDCRADDVRGTCTVMAREGGPASE